MSADIWMPIYWADWMKDTAQLSLQEQGAYLMLIKECWNNGGSIKDDKTRIYRSSGAQSRSEKESVNFILETYFLHENDMYSHSRVTEELEKAVENQEKHRKKTEAATAARWQKKSSVTDNVTESVTESPSPSPSPSCCIEEGKEPSSQQQPSATLFEEIQTLINSPIPLDLSRVPIWLANGATPELITSTITRLMAKRGNSPPPKSIKYFEEAVADAIAETTRPMEAGHAAHSGKINGSHQPTKSERARAALARGLEKALAEPVH